MKIVAYEESFGVIRFPDGFEETLQNLPLEEQMARYRTTGFRRIAATGWRERRFEGITMRLEKDDCVKALIVKDGILVGVMMEDDNGREVPCMPEEGVCTYYGSDNNGAGYKERIDYTYLICVSEDFLKDVE